PAEQEGKIWLDWSFIDFWKSNQRTLPGFFITLDSLAVIGPSAESAMLINSLRRHSLSSARDRRTATSSQG
ncbi:hypothetical protein P692DRAFT_20898063, partial [Suillus brevipes Sb2]